jgi:YVTN family beta-propeller protein
MLISKKKLKRVVPLGGVLLLAASLFFATADTSKAATSVTVTSPTSGSTVSGTDFTVTGTASANRKIAVKVNGALVASTTSDGSGAWSLAITGQAAGAKTVEATASTQFMYTNVLNAGDFSASRMSRINTLTNTQESSFSVYAAGAFPITWKPNPTFTKAYGVAPYLNSGTVWVMDLISGTVNTFTLPGSGQRGASVAYNDDGSRVYITDNANTDVLVYNTSNNAQVGSAIPVGGAPHSSTKRPGHDEIWVANSFDDTLSVINIGSNTVTNTYATSDSPNGMAFSPDGNLAYIGVNDGSGAVEVLNANTGAVVDSMPGAGVAEWLTINAGGTKLYSSHPLSNTIDVFDLTTNTLEDTITVGTGPWSMALTADESLLYVTKPDLNGGFSGTQIAIVDTATNTVTSNITPGDGGPFFIWAAPTESATDTVSFTLAATGSGAGLADTGMDATRLVIVASALVGLGLLSGTYLVLRHYYHSS